jgi:hypothetical protein
MRQERFGPSLTDLWLSAAEDKRGREGQSLTSAPGGAGVLRQGAQTHFEVIKGEPDLVERCDIASKIAELRAPSDLTRPPAKSLP